MRRVFSFTVTVLALTVGAAGAQEICGPLQNAFGPFDYRTAKPEARALVENAHFDEGVAALRRGLSSKLGGDIDYTLRAFPNHPRALTSMMNLARREKRERPDAAKYTISCYFDRALRFMPDDPSVRTVFGIFLLKQGKKTEAAEQLEEARRLSSDSPSVNYNLGLAYFELNDYDKAIEAAQKAYDGGFELPGLRNKLQQVGRWDPNSSPTAPVAQPMAPKARAMVPTAAEGSRSPALTGSAH